MHFGSIFVPVSLVLTLLWWFWAKPALERQEAREADAKAERRKNAELREWLDDLTARREAHKAERERPDPTPGEIAEMRAELLAYGRPAALLQRRWPPAPRQTALRSYFGGLPRLAPDQVWPVGEDGHALTFLCQIDLGELPAEVAVVAEGLEGTLLFFSNTNFDGVGDPWSAVLYRPGRGDDFEERAPPATLMLAGGWQEAQLYPWLEVEEEGARGDLRQAMTFAPFTSYADTQGDGVALWNTRTAHQMAYQALQMEAFRAALPQPVPKPIRESRTSPHHDAAWPVSWIFVAHASRGLAQLVSNLSSEHREACALEREAQDWISEAGDRLWVPLPPDRHAAFRAWWSAARARLTQRVGSELPPVFERVFDEQEQLATDLATGLCGLADEPPATALRAKSWSWSEGASHESLPVIRSSFPKHQMFGYGLSVQNAVGEHWEDILLLQIACEDDLAWAKHCGYGVLQFWISPEALAARRFSEVTVTFETD
jgi:hypothetical protein